MYTQGVFMVFDLVKLEFSKSINLLKHGIKQSLEKWSSCQNGADQKFLCSIFTSNNRLKKYSF